MATRRNTGTRAQARSPLPVLAIVGVGIGATALLYALSRRAAAQRQLAAIQNGGALGGTPTGILPVSPATLTRGRIFATTVAFATPTHPLAGQYTVLQPPDPVMNTVSAQNLDTGATENVPLSAISQVFGNA